MRERKELFRGAEFGLSAEGFKTKHPAQSRNGADATLFNRSADIANAAREKLEGLGKGRIMHCYGNILTSRHWPTKKRNKLREKSDDRF
jgi:hypothetical protein